jgi:hypothetical protein
MTTLKKIFNSPLFTRFGILATLVLTLAVVSFPQTPAAKAVCGHCWWSIGANAWMCSIDVNNWCTLGTDQWGNSSCYGTDGQCRGGKGPAGLEGE